MSLTNQGWVKFDFCIILSAVVRQKRNNMADGCSRNFSERNCFDIFAEVLGKKTAIKKWKELYTCIRTVDCGIKNSYLLDTCNVTPVQIERLIKRLCNEDFLSGEELDILVICEDTFVLHEQRVSEYLSSALDDDKICFVDVSQHLPEPKVLKYELEFQKTVKDFCIQFIEFLKQRTAQPSDERTNVGSIKCFGCDKTNLDPCSIFGLILGYPVVYWCNQESTSNCLSQCKLTLHTVTVQFSQLTTNSFTVTSFSLPSSLSDSCERYIKSWKDRVLETSEKDGVVLRISCKHATLPVVVLWLGGVWKFAKMFCHLKIKLFLVFWIIVATT